MSVHLFLFCRNHPHLTYKGFPGGSDGKASAHNVGDLGSIPEQGKSPGEGNGNSLQYYCLENSMDGEAWWPTVHGVSKSQKRRSDFTHFTMSLCVSLCLCICFCFVEIIPIKHIKGNKDPKEWPEMFFVPEKTGALTGTHVDYPAPILLKLD